MGRKFRVRHYSNTLNSKQYFGGKFNGSFPVYILTMYFHAGGILERFGVLKCDFCLSKRTQPIPVCQECRGAGHYPVLDVDGGRGRVVPWQAEHRQKVAIISCH